MASDSTANWYLALWHHALKIIVRIAYNLNGSGASVNDSEVILGAVSSHLTYRQMQTTSAHQLRQRL